MLNLFILILMSTFEDNYINQDNPIEAYSSFIEKFKEQWIINCDKKLFYFMNHMYL